MSTPRTRPPFRADHVGSLLRPEALLKARAEHAAGRIDNDELRAAEDAAILDAIRLQKDVGLPTVTDGEMRRASWHMDFILSLQGIELGTDHLNVEFHSDEGDIAFQPTAPKVTGKLGLAHAVFEDAFKFLRDHASEGQTPKLTIPSPSMVHYSSGRQRISQEVYPDMEPFWSDLSAAYGAQIAWLEDLGCSYIQLDDTSLAYMNDPSQREYIASFGGDPEHQHETYIETFNRAISGRREGTTITTHLCRGNYKSAWRATGSYEFVAEALFGGLDVDGFFLEYDDERSGGFEPLRFVPPGKMVVLGMITTKRPELESKDELKRRVEEASKYVDGDQLCLSPQCGFSSTVDGNALTVDQELAKLQLVVETAAEIWG
ncbi:MAG TPA: 5-methyltetrahydropteroyltriglutamate--homocysteine S-methyltransferase [Solirubrobacteraceae bacterium]|jgi:5-methyltetrahydropteroyltriglutamate--homocysteine methyltransferase|nr:5-methyltetrahydropteroyltriglutamate--homocysteine S-methyltransferase [Solirubrobacteraceae bacterium]